MIAQPKNVDDYEIKLNIPVMISILIIFGLMFWIHGIKNKLKCYETINQEECNKIYK